MQRSILLKLGFWFAAAALFVAGCAARQPTVLGKAPAAGPIVSVRALGASRQPVILQGRMIEKCPVAGCWFILQDSTGVIKVDTKDAGFTVTDVPNNTVVTAAGTLRTAGERSLAATGVSY